MKSLKPTGKRLLRGLIGRTENDPQIGRIDIRLVSSVGSYLRGSMTRNKYDKRQPRANYNSRWPETFIMETIVSRTRIIQVSVLYKDRHPDCSQCLVTKGLSTSFRQMDLSPAMRKYRQYNRP